MTGSDSDTDGGPVVPGSGDGSRRTAGPAAGVVFGDRAVYLPEAEAAVIADVHVGRDEASTVSLPLGERADLRDRLDGLLDRFDPETVVVAGDAVHTFGRVTDRSRRTLDALRDACEANGATLELVAGNHDAALASAWDEPVREEYVLGPPRRRDDGGDGNRDAPRTVVCHGHEPPSTAADRYVVGHVHPTIEIEGDRRPCFLRGAGTYRGADVLVLPAFTRLAPGVAVNDAVDGGLDSSLVPDAGAMAPTVYDTDRGDAVRFPPLGEFRGLL